MLKNGYGITNLVARPTLSASELTRDEIREGARILERKVRRLRPKIVAILSVSAFRIAFNEKNAHVGPQPSTISNARVWVLPCPSGLNAHFPPKKLATLFRALKKAADDRNS